MKSNWKSAVFSVKKSKTFKIMRLLMIFCFFFVSGAMANGYSQEQVVSLNLHQCDVNTLCQEIWKQTGLRFIYNEEHVKNLTAFDVKADKKTVREVLDQVFDNTSLRYFFEQDVIYILAKSGQVKKQETKQASGTVKDKKGEPLPGVTVLIKGTHNGVVTDIDGNFMIKIPRDTVTFVFSFVGMKTKEVVATPNKAMMITLEEDTQTIEEVVITGYQVVDKRKNTSAITSVKAADIMRPGITTIDQMLEGQIPDLISMTNSGEIGVAPKLRIRGTSTLIGNREPLWVIDGIVQQDPVNISPEELNNPDYINRIGNAIAGLNPQDIDRIDVLKDAAATALYGTKAANGVIVITTKKGHVGRPVVTYSMNMTLRQRPSYNDRSVNVMNSQERMRFSRELVAQHYQFPNDMSMVGYEGLITKLYNHEIDIQQFDQEVAKLETVNTDWFDLLTRNSLSHQHTISISGGSEEARYYASIGYNRDNDVIGDDNNERYTATLNLDANLTPWLTASLSMNGNVSSRDYYQNELAPMQYAYKTTRALPAFDEKGEYYFYQRKYNNYTYYNFNILNELENSSYGQEGSALTVNANLQFKFTNWLNANAIVAYTASHTTIEGWWGEKSYHAACLRKTENGVQAEKGDGTGCTLPYGGELSRSESNNRNYTVRLQLNASKYFGEEQQRF